jgi:hypothetical protein
MHHGPKAIRRTLLAASLVLAFVVGVVGLAGPADAGSGNLPDAFADRFPIAGTSAAVFGSTVGATVEPGEPHAACCGAENTVWARWTATFSGPALLDTLGSQMDTQVGLYTGSALASLDEVDGDDDSGPGYTSRIEFEAVKGTQYQIQVDGFSGQQGQFLLRVNPVTFDDVSRTYPFWRDVEWIAGEQIAEGYQDGGYHPTVNISRAAMSAFLYRLAADPFLPPVTPSFSDVGTSHPFFREIEWMNHEEITTGYSDDTFRPGAPVSRGAMAAFIYRYDDDPSPYDPPEAPTFDDVGLNHPFFLEVEWMNERGITTGYADHTFRPAAAVTRGAMAAFLARYDHGLIPAM